MFGPVLLPIDPLTPRSAVSCVIADGVSRSLYPDPVNTTRVDINLLQEYERRGFVRSGRHPCYDLYIWNYSELVNNSGLFDEVTSAARALVTDSQRNVMARSFPKFFNKGDKLAHRPADHADFTVQEKLDGSMGLLFHFEGKWHISSRGSFDNSQVDIATALLHSQYLTSKLNAAVTYTFEIIHPNNRVILDYGARAELVMLAAFHIDGSEIFPLPPEVQECGFSPARTYSGEEFAALDDLKKLEWNKAEGFVVRFSDGGRLKIKFAAYLMAHRAVSNTCVGTLIRAFASGCQIEELASSSFLPDEYAPWVRQTWQAFASEVAESLSCANEVHARLAREADGNRGLYAKNAKAEKDVKALFLLLDGKPQEDVEACIVSRMLREYEKLDEGPNLTMS